jgi:membrane protein DedA with SNARE-associated domain
MSIASLVESYGYVAVFAGTFLEGETVLLAAGFAAHRGMLDLRTVMLVAFLASTLGDQFYFLVGRRWGTRLVGRFPVLARQVPRAERLLATWHTPLILAVRFLYGLRVAGPFAMGMAGVPPLRFSLLNMLGAAVWAALVAGLGYQFGGALEWALRDLRRVEEAVLAAILVAGGAWAAFRFWRSRTRR